MARFQETPQKGDRVFRVRVGGTREDGRVEERESGRTGKPYLVVVITTGPRKGRWEFPNRNNWQVDLAYNPAFDRPDHDEPYYTLKQHQAYGRIRKEARARRARGEPDPKREPTPHVEPAPKHPPECTCEECGPF